MKVIIRVLIVLACVALLYSSFGIIGWIVDYSIKHGYRWWNMPTAVLISLTHVSIGVFLMIKFLNTFEQK